MVTIEEQLLEAQNRLLEWQKKEVKNTMKVDELTERAEFYENLHNKEQENLYNAENECISLKDQNRKLIAEIEKVKKELEVVKSRNVENVKTKELISLILLRVRYKLFGR